MNISSVVVDARPECLASVQNALLSCPGVEIHASTPEGKFIVTIETDTDAETTQTFYRINEMDGVMSVAMVYHQLEQDPEQEVSHGFDAT